MADETGGKEKVRTFYDAVAKDYGDRYDPAALVEREHYSANYFRHRILVDRLKDGNASTVYEIGCGEGTPLVMLASQGFKVSGCDISENMVASTREKFVTAGIPAERCKVADVEKLDTLADHVAAGPYDAVVAFGVFPHVDSVTATLATMRALTKTGGTLFFEYRNKLFSLFTYNRLTHDLIVNDLLKDVGEDVRKAVGADLEKRVAMDKPAARRLKEGVSYDTVQANYHVPFEWPGRLEAAGFSYRRHHWYHFHAAPPMLEEAVGRRRYREESIKLEGRTDDWRGHFLCSAGVVEAKAV
jgi:2-polyprenyl-3-methyl-5-hydroxy-6-metoxy-1,4-benzoquinol methylase